MKKLLLTSILLMSSIQVFAKCEAVVEMRVFSNPFAVASESKEYAKLLKTMRKIYEFKIVENKSEAAYVVNVEAGIEKGDEHDILLSHFQITNRKGKVVFEDYKHKKVSKDKLIPTEKIIKYSVRHLEKALPICNS
jgi:hypothetical protein